MRSSLFQFPPHNLCLDPRWKQDVPEGPLKPVKQRHVVEKGEGGLPPTHHSDTTSEGHT